MGCYFSPLCAEKRKPCLCSASILVEGTVNTATSPPSSSRISWEKGYWVKVPLSGVQWGGATTRILRMQEQEWEAASWPPSLLQSGARFVRHDVPMRVTFGIYSNHIMYNRQSSRAWRLTIMCLYWVIMTPAAYCTPRSPRLANDYRPLPTSLSMFFH